MIGVSMSPHMKWGIAGVVLGLILWIVSPWAMLAVIAAAIVIPTVAWRMLDESQRRRYRELRRRQRGELR
jgi:protein-S-isoprenylcysteine O-methyltransferase Ste14